MAAGAWAGGTTQIVDAKIAEVTERGFVLQVGTDSISVEDSGSTKFWKGKAAVKRGAFAVSDLVTARIKTSTDTPELREIADRESWKWLDNVRKQPVVGTIEKVDPKYLTLKLEDGTSFSYRATEKSKVEMKGRPDMKLTDLEVGQKVYAKGRTLATLDTWLALITDTPLAPKAVKGKSSGGKRGSKAKVLPAHGSIDGLVLGHTAQFHMFDIAHDAATLHITYTSTTKFILDGIAVKAVAIQPNQKTIVFYSRDKFGRIVASRVELSTR